MPTDETPAAVWVPKHVTDVEHHVRHVIGPTEGLCMHVETKGTGSWVCVYPAEHEGRHG